MSLRSLNLQQLRTFQTRFPTSIAEVDPVIFPIAGNAGEEAARGWLSLGTAEEHAAIIDNANLSDRFRRVHHIFGRIIEVQYLARQRNLREILRRHRLRVVEQNKYFGAAELAVN